MNEFRPLYARIRQTLVDRLAAGEWAPGTALPSEAALARELGASQGTVRKAVGLLVDEGVLQREQGRGTFVAEQTPEHANYRFFRLFHPDGERAVPELLRQVGGVKKADAGQAAALDIEPGTDVQVLVRLRTIAGAPALEETIAIPMEIMPELMIFSPLPNALYPYYQSRYGLHVARTEERVSATAATERQARKLEIAAGAPLLRIERTAYDLNARPIEHRVSHFVTNGLTFRVDLR